MITIKNKQRTVVIDIKKLENDIKVILHALNYDDFDIGILLTTNKTIHTYNRDYRNQDKPTDILSFPYHTSLQAGQRIVPQSDEDKNLGDIIISPRYVMDDLARWEQSFDERMRVLLVHGICHLLGYDHIEDEDYKIMHAQETFLLSKLT